MTPTNTETDAELRAAFEYECPVFPFGMRHDGLGYACIDTETAFKCFKAGWLSRATDSAAGRDAVIEECARVCDALATVDAAFAKQPTREHYGQSVKVLENAAMKIRALQSSRATDSAAGRDNVIEECASAIRSKKTTGGDGPINKLLDECISLVRALKSPPAGQPVGE